MLPARVCPIENRHPKNPPGLSSLPLHPNRGPDTPWDLSSCPPGPSDPRWHRAVVVLLGADTIFINAEVQAAASYSVFSPVAALFFAPDLETPEKRGLLPSPAGK